MRMLLIVLGAMAGLFGATGVGLAAIGAHLSGNPAVTTSAYFLLFHAGALVAFCAIGVSRRSNILLVGAAVIAVGTVLFSGELALHALAGVKFLSMAAPTGGVLMILGWLVVAGALPACLASYKSEHF